MSTLNMDTKTDAELETLCRELDIRPGNRDTMIARINHKNGIVPASKKTIKTFPMWKKIQKKEPEKPSQNDVLPDTRPMNILFCDPQYKQRIDSAYRRIHSEKDECDFWSYEEYRTFLKERMRMKKMQKGLMRKMIRSYGQEISRSASRSQLLDALVDQLTYETDSDAESDGVSVDSSDSSDSD